MPGPDGPWGDALVEAVAAGEVDEAVDRPQGAAHPARSPQRVGALEGSEPPAEPVHVEDGIRVRPRGGRRGHRCCWSNRRASCRWDADCAQRGRRDRRTTPANARTQGGGSATVLPAYMVSPLDGTARRAARTPRSPTRSAPSSQDGLAELPLDQLTNPRHRRARRAGAVPRRGRRGALRRGPPQPAPLVWFGGDAPISDVARRRADAPATRRPRRGDVRLGFAMVGRGRVCVDGELRHRRGRSPPVGDDLGAAFLHAAERADADHADGRDARRPPRSRSTSEPTRTSWPARCRSQFGIEPDAEDHDALIAEAAAAAARRRRRARGGRHQLRGRVRGLRPRHARPARPAGRPGARPSRPRTRAPSCVVNAGSPGADAVARRRRGRPASATSAARSSATPSPTCCSASSSPAAGCPPRGRSRGRGRARALDVTPVDGVARATTRASTSATAPGSRPTPPRRTGSATASATPTSRSPTSRLRRAASRRRGRHRHRLARRTRGERDGKQVVQVYAERADSTVDRPVRWLVGLRPRAGRRRARARPSTSRCPTAAARLLGRRLALRARRLHAARSAPASSTCPSTPPWS